MLSRWSIGNFKSISGQLDLELAPLTIVCGANSSGKSTILQSMIAVAQTFRANSQTRVLILNGPLVRLGHFEDLLHAGNGDQADDISIGFSLTTQAVQSLDLDATIRRVRQDATHDGRDELPLVAYYGLTGRIDASARQSEKLALMLSHEPTSPIDGFEHRVVRMAGIDIDSARAGDMALTHMELRGLTPATALMEYNERTRAADAAFDKMRAIVADAQLPSGSADHLVPDAIAELFRMVSRQRGVEASSLGDDLAQLATDIDVRPFTWGELFQRINGGEASSTSAWPQSRDRRKWSDIDRTIVRDRCAGLRPQWLEQIHRNRENKAFERRHLPTSLRVAAQELRAFWTDRFSYLGPLRDDPKVVFAAPTDVERLSVGVKGEYTAAVLTEWGGRPIRYPQPPSRDDGTALQSVTGTLVEGVGVWLHHMGLVDRVSTRELTKVGYEMTVESSGVSKSLDLMNVGVGVSQILPTLVMSLIAPLGSTLVFEQPELHLHPKVQSILGDFLLGMAAMGKQCIVETHSEHLINRIRRRIAESEGKSLMQLVRMYFAQRPATATEIVTVAPNEYGAITDWPEGFFDEAVSETDLIIRAATKKREAKLAAARDRRRQSK